jgi:hypothetical protein
MVSMKLEIQMARKQKLSFSKHIDAAIRHRIFRALQEAMQINADGQIYWGPDGEVHQHISVLRDAFEFSKELSSGECAKAVGRGLLDARKKGDLNDSSVMEELQRLTDTALAQKLRRYSMWSRVSYKPPVNSPEKSLIMAMFQSSWRHTCLLTCSFRQTRCVICGPFQ